MGIAWQENLAVGVDTIDDQHKELLRRFDSLLQACNKGRGREELVRLLNFLNEYVICHFRDEEKLQQDCGYPGYSSHCQEHDHFIERLKGLQKELAVEGASLPVVIRTNNVMLDWLINHIAKSDTKIGEFLRHRGAVTGSGTPPGLAEGG